MNIHEKRIHHRGTEGTEEEGESILMKANIKKYDDSVDFMRVRDFLIDTFSLYQRPFNWCIDRWNFCRYFVVPIHTYYNVQYFGVPTQTAQPHRDELIYWRENNRIWENENGDIVGVITSENEEPGEAWIQIHPDYTFLYDEMITYIEENLADRVDGLAYSLIDKTGYLQHCCVHWPKAEIGTRAFKFWQRLNIYRRFLDLHLTSSPFYHEEPQTAPGS